VRRQRFEEALVSPPPFEQRLVLASEVSLARGWKAIEQLTIRSSAKHDAGLPMTGGKHAESPRLQVKGVGRRQAGERMKSDNEVELESLKTVRGIDGDPFDTPLRRRPPQSPDLVAV